MTSQPNCPFGCTTGPYAAAAARATAFAQKHLGFVLPPGCEIEDSLLHEEPHPIEILANDRLEKMGFCRNEYADAAASGEGNRLVAVATRPDLGLWACPWLHNSSFIGRYPGVQGVKTICVGLRATGTAVYFLLVRERALVKENSSRTSFKRSTYFPTKPGK